MPDPHINTYQVSSVVLELKDGVLTAEAQKELGILLGTSKYISGPIPSVSVTDRTGRTEVIGVTYIFGK